MPLKRTPPPQLPVSSDYQEPTTPSLSHPTISLSGSAPNLCSIDVGNVTQRSKRKREDDVSSFMEEIRNLLQSSNAQSETKFMALQKSMSEIIAQNSEIKTSLDFVSKQYDELKVKITDLEKERKAEHGYIKQLEDKIENLERTLCLTKMEVKNIPKQEKETKEDLRRIITQTAGVLDISIERQDIKDIFRLNKKEGIPSIIVEFSSVITKESVLDKVRKYNRNHYQNKLNTAHIQLKGETKPIYLSECLTPKSQRLYNLARKFASEKGFKFCWTSHGKVFLRN